MKKFSFLLAVAAISFTASAQNEFANEKFYSAVKKIYADGQKSFATYKGPKTGSLGTLIDFYKVNLMLPGADSGKISVPTIGFPDVSYDFKPAKTLEQASQKIKLLAEALKTAAGKTFYEQQKTSQLKNFTFYKTLLYTMPSPQWYDNADFELYTVLDKGAYVINVKINASAPASAPAPAKTTKLKTDNNLTAEIKTALNDVDNYFATEKTTLKETNKYDTRYNGRTQLFGFPSEVKETSYNMSWSLYLGADILLGADESTATYEKLKAACIAAGISFDAEKTEGTHKQVFASMTTSAGKKYTVLLGCYFETYTSSVSLTLFRYK